MEVGPIREREGEREEFDSPDLGVLRWHGLCRHFDSPIFGTPRVQWLCSYFDFLSTLGTLQRQGRHLTTTWASKSAGVM